MPKTAVLLGLALLLSCFVATNLAAPASPVQTIQPRAWEVPDLDAGQATVKNLKPAADNAPANLAIPQPTQVLSLVAPNLDDALSIDIGYVPVQPDTRYRASFLVRPEKLAEDANLYIMAREHTAKNTRPIQPYHKTSIRDRVLSVASVGQWIDRGEEFVTGPNTRFLSIAVIVAKLHGELSFGPFTVTDVNTQAKIEYQQVLKEVRQQAASRPRILPRTLVYSRSQMKYGLDGNYYHIWTDRPLFVDRSLRLPRKYVTPFESYKRILEKEVEPYDMDGLAFFPETKDRMGMFELNDQANMPHISILPEFIPTFDIDAKMKVLEEALKCKTAARINGKVLITSYVASSVTPEQWDQTFKALRAKHGDCFIFLPALTDTVSLMGPFQRGEDISRRVIEERKAYLRTWLDVCDGIYFNYPAAFKNHDHTFNEQFYRELFIPVFKSVLAEPKYRQKYLGLSAYHSHSNPDLAIGLVEDGTRTMRHSFEAAIEAEPDVLILPEWDEVNENTCFRPTVNNSTSSMRIIRYYMSQIRQKAPTPVPNDDTSIPNLILSTRKVLTVGDALEIELLNVPDGVAKEPYTVQLTIVDEAGKTVRAFEPVTFAPDKLLEHRLTLPTEECAQARALIPQLKIAGYQGKALTYDRGFHPVQLRATSNWDYKWVTQSLRDLLQPQEAQIAWASSTPDADGAMTIRGKVNSPEELALVEILADDDETFVVDAADKHGLQDSNRVLMLIEYRALRSLDIEGTVTLKNAKAQWFFNQPNLHQREGEHDASETTVQFKGPASPHVRWMGLSVNRSDINAAELVIDWNKAKFTVPLRRVLENGMIAQGYDGGLHVTVKVQRRPLDMPFHVDAKSTAFEARVWPWLATEQHHLRITTKSGKTWRSAPLMLSAVADIATTKLRVWSVTQNRGVDVQVPANRVPDITYNFDPSLGAVLLTDAGRPFWATLGGFLDTTSGRGGNGGGGSASVFQGVRAGYPDNGTFTAPKWTESDGKPCLEFDGIGTFLQLPRDTIPRDGSFTVEFEVKPLVKKNQVLLVQRTYRVGSLEVRLDDKGLLHASWLNSEGQRAALDTELAVPTDQWSNIRVSYDFENLRVAVNGKQASVPCEGPGLNMAPIAIGGYGEAAKGFDPQTGNPGWFKGQLRSLRILHNVVPDQR